MPGADITKQAIVQTVKEMMASSTLERISVSLITEKCGLNRNTFYYHFQDKYNVLEWIFKTELLPVLEPFMSAEHWVEGVAVLCKQLREEKKFYTNAMRSEDSRGLRELLREYYKSFFLNSLSIFSMDGETEEGKQLIARFYSHAIIGLLTDWVNYGMKKDPADSIAVISAAFKNRIVITPTTK